MLTYSPTIARSWAKPAAQPGNFSEMPKKSALATVLVVDDEALIRWTLVQALGELGYAVTEAGDGQGAIAAVERVIDPFDVVLLDYRLPDSADLRLLGTLKRLAPDSRIIMVTAHCSPELAQGATALGAFRVISKPFDLESLVAIVELARKDGSSSSLDGSSSR
jgi:DNA-binding NtrC family response regulator